MRFYTSGTSPTRRGSSVSGALPTEAMRSCLRLLLIASASGARLSLHKAAERGDLPPLKVASEGHRDEYEDEWVKPDLNAQNKRGDVALHLALCNQRLDIAAARLLLEKGADANARDGKGRTPLYVVATLCGEPERFQKLAVPLAKLLIKHGARLAESSTEQLLTPLHAAASSVHPGAPSPPVHRLQTSWWGSIKTLIPYSLALRTTATR